MNSEIDTAYQLICENDLNIRLIDNYILKQNYNLLLQEGSFSSKSASIKEKIKKILNTIINTIHNFIKNVKKFAVLLYNKIFRKNKQKQDYGNGRSAVSKEFKDAVNQKDTLLARIMLNDSLIIDPTFQEFDELIGYAEKRLDDLYDKHDGEVFSNDISKWTKSLIDEQTGKCIQNFSKERISFLKKLCSYIYADRIEEKNTVERNNDNNILKEFKDAVNQKKIRLVRIMLANSLLIDKTFQEFDSYIKYAEKRLGNIYDKHDGEKFESDKSKWTKSLIDQQTGKCAYNFSRERIDFIKKLITHCYSEARNESSDILVYEQLIEIEDSNRIHNNMDKCLSLLYSKNIDNLNILQKIASNVNDIDKMKDVINQYTNRTKFDIAENIFGTNDITDENIRKYLFKDSSVQVDSSNSSRYIYDLDKLASKTKKYSNDIEKILNKSMQCTNQIKNSVNTSELNMEITTIINRITSAIMRMFNISLKAIQNTYIIISKNNSALRRV